MMKNNIIDAIEQKVGATSFTLWTIGVTNDPDSTKALLESIDAPVLYWEYWKTCSDSDTKEILRYFLDKGMRLSVGSNGDTGGVYIF